MYLIPIILSVLVAGSCLAQAQDSTLSNPLDPGRRYQPSKIGVIFGPSFHMQDGVFYTKCGDRFAEGAQTGYMIGALYTSKIASSRFAYGVRLAYEHRNLTAVYSEYELIDNIPSSTPGQTLKESILFRNEAELDFSLLSVTPYVEWSPFWNAFFHVGIMPQFVLSSHVSHIKKAAQQSVTLDDGQVVYIAFEGENAEQATVEDGAIPDVQSFQLGIAGGIGIDIPISKKITLMPLYQYVVPLTTLSERGQSFKIRASQLLIAATIEF